MNTARQLLRFSIPGTVLILAVLFLQSCMMLSWGDSVHGTSSQFGTGSVVATLASSIPIGFVLYQLYFVVYRPRRRLFPLPFVPSYPTLDRGAFVIGLVPGMTDWVESTFKVKVGSLYVLEQIDPKRSNSIVRIPPFRWLHLLQVREEQKESFIETRFVESLNADPVDLNDQGSEISGDLSSNLTQLISSRLEDISRLARLIDGRPNKRNSDFDSKYARSWYANWQVVMASIDYFSSANKNPEVKQEYTGLSDIYHSLGAGRIAVTIAPFAVIALDLATRFRNFDGPHQKYVVAMTFGIFAMAFAMVVVLHFARRNTERALLFSVVLNMRSLIDRENAPLGM